MPMRVQTRAGSPSEARYFNQSALPSGPWPMPKAIAPGIDPAPLQDLIFHGGKVVPQMEFQNVYLGGNEAWAARDIERIDSAIARVMRHKQLDNVMRQYFPGVKPACEMRESFVLDPPQPRRLDEPDVQASVIAMYDAGLLAKRGLDTFLVNLILPPGTTLALDRDTSLQGLGGYHGSVHVRRRRKRITLYYSANVFSQRLPDGRENGIVSFDQPWKNVVATLVHEINEFRTDPDVGDAIAHDNDDFLGWMSRQGHEIGDQPIFKADGDLRLVFKEVQDPPRKVRLPVQFMYSNAVHGPEGPIRQPHA
jgi:hypothetical protein